MKEFKTSDIRNVSIIGSAQAGKTTIGDAIFFNSALASRQGNVDDGSSNLDFYPEEIDKKNSIYSSILSIEHGSTKINFIDNPGYPSFVSNVVTSTNICETSLIVIDADAGIDVGTKKAWRQANKEGQSKVIFINKMDKERTEYSKILTEARTVLSPKLFAFTIPVEDDGTITGYVNVLKEKAYIGRDKNVKEQDVPENLKDIVSTIKTELIESAAEGSEELLDKFLENGTLDDQDLIKGIKLGIISNDICPVVFGSARNNIGITALNDILSSFAPSPDAKKKPVFCLDSSGKELTRLVNNEDPTLLHIFKIIDDPKIGEFFLFKVVQGKVMSSQEIINSNNSQKERIGHIFSFQGKNKNEVEVMNAGDIGATAKLKTVKIGHTLSFSKDGVKIKDFDFPTPVHSECVKTESEKDNEKMVEGLQAIHRVDPCFKHEHRAEFNEIITSGIDKLHIDIMINKIKSKLNIGINLEKPNIAYRETIRTSAKAQGKYKKQTGGHGQYGDAQIEISPRSLGEGYLFVDAITGGVIPGKYIPAVDKGVQEAMSRGVLAGFPVVDIEVKVFYGSYHNVDSSDLAFQMAGRMAFRKAAELAKPILLEPIMNVKVTVPDSCVGDVSADFNQRRGKIISIEPGSDGYTVLNANIPQSEMYNYSVDLKSMTKGDAEFSETIDKYEPVPAIFADKIIKAFKKEEE